jgi:hypothetical protein
MIKIMTALGVFALACYVWALILEIKECRTKRSFD